MSEFEKDLGIGERLYLLKEELAETKKALTAEAAQNAELKKCLNVYREILVGFGFKAEVNETSQSHYSELAAWQAQVVEAAKEHENQTDTLCLFEKFADILAKEPK